MYINNYLGEIRFCYSDKTTVYFSNARMGSSIRFHVSHIVELLNQIKYSQAPRLILVYKDELLDYTGFWEGEVRKDGEWYCKLGCQMLSREDIDKITIFLVANRINLDVPIPKEKVYEYGKGQIIVVER